MAQLPSEADVSITNIVQVAGVRDLEEAAMLAATGVDWIGFPLRLPVHAEDLSEQDTGDVIRNLPAGVTPVLITYELSAQRLVAMCHDLQVSHLQAHGDIQTGELHCLRQLAPDLFIIKSLVVRDDNGAELRETTRRCEPFVDAFITDTFDPVTGAYGATGLTHDLRISRMLVAGSRRPVILAGGLNADNVSAAIETVRPAGVDVHTGVEGPDGRKSPEAVRRFVDRARTAFRMPDGVRR